MFFRDFHVLKAMQAAQMFEREGGGGAGVWVRGWALGWKASSSRKARNRKKRGNNSRKRERQFSGTKAWDGAVKH